MLVREDKGKATVPKSEHEKDPKRARMVLSKGCEVVRLCYPRISGDAARAADRGEESGNPNRVRRVHQEYDTDRQIDQVTRDNRGNREGYSGQRADQLTRDSRGK
jgi:hypothetical protein